MYPLMSDIREMRGAEIYVETPKNPKSQESIAKESFKTHDKTTVIKITWHRQKIDK